MALRKRGVLKPSRCSLAGEDIVFAVAADGGQRPQSEETIS
jgi:hypothetical protein